MAKPLALIVEDDEDLASIFTEATRAAGYQVETIRTGDAAMERLNEVTPFMLVLDLHLPGVTGPQILKHVRGDARLSKILVIIASADDRLADYNREKATMVLLKPISFVQLRDLTMRLRPAESA